VSPGFRVGLALSAVAAVALLALLAIARWPRLRIRRGERMPAARSLLGEPPAERETAAVS
jgi:hypothetical protein